MNKKPPVTPIFPRNNGPVLPEKMSTQDYLKAAGQRALNRFGSPEAGTNPRDSAGIVSEAPRFLASQLNCITIAQHIDTCPICSKLYDTDKTLYLLVIFGLLIACFLLVRRLLNF